MRAFYFVVDEGYEPIASAQAMRLITLSAADVHIFLERRDPSAAWRQSAVHPRIHYHVDRLAATLPDDLPSDNKWPKIVYKRIFVPSSINKYERLIYLDADIYVNYVPEWIWTVDLPYGLAAVHDMGILGERAPGHVRSVGEWLQALGLKDIRYFNSGVLVIDVDAWCRHDWPGLLKQYFEEYGLEVRAFDQDFLNYTFNGKWLELSPRFNFQVTLFYKGLEYFFKPCFVHFTDGAKPWQPELKAYDDSFSTLYTRLFAAAGIAAPVATAARKPARRLREIVRLTLARWGFVTRRERRLRHRFERSSMEIRVFLESSLREKRFADPLPIDFEMRLPTVYFTGRYLFAPHVPTEYDPLLPAEIVTGESEP